jgi:hypothetical protein
MVSLTLAFTLISLTAAAVQAAERQAGTPAEIVAFAEALDGCTPATAKTPHPLMTTFVVEHTVNGEKDGACGYAQTMPGRMKMVCTLSGDGRRALSAELKTMASGGPMRGGTSAAQPVWMKECEIELPSGSRVPAVQTRAPR